MKHALYQEPLRPRFHFTARYFDDPRLNPGWHEEGWINDINGLFQLDGEYHLFAQRWWSCWLHAVSDDLVHWTELEPAFGKTEEIEGTQSGGAVVDTDNTSGLATGDNPVIVAFWSGTDNASQCISYSNDKGKTWNFYKDNPVLTYPLRDPRVFRHEPSGTWIMVLFSQSEEHGNHYQLFSSDNLLRWEKQGMIPDMWECPDMFELPLVGGEEGETRWVVIDGNGDYVVGSFDGKVFTSDTEKLTGDYGRNFYATMTWHEFPDEPWRRVQIAWMRAFETAMDMPFSQQLTFPCDLTLRQTTTGPRLCRWPIPEIRHLVKEHHSHHFPAAEGTLCFETLTDPAMDIEARIHLDRSTCNAFRIVINGYPLGFNLKEGKLNLYGKVTELPLQGDVLEIRILADTCSMEMFLDRGRMAFSHCPMPVDARTRVEVQVDDGILCLENLDIRVLESMWKTP